MNDSITTEIVHVVSSVLNIMHLYEKILIEVSQQSMMELLFNINWVSLLYVHILQVTALGNILMILFSWSLRPQQVQWLKSSFSLLIAWFHQLAAGSSQIRLPHQCSMLYVLVIKAVFILYV